MSELLWNPTEERIANSEMSRFTEWLSSQKSLQFNGYLELHKWSIENPENFWESFINFTGIKFSGSYSNVLSSYKMPGAEWFPGMKLNYTQNIIDNNFSGTAIRYYIEKPLTGNQFKGSYSGELTFHQLRVLVARCANALIKSGVGKGDKVAGYMANVPETIIAALASASIGAIWSSASPDFGLDALCERFVQVQPKIIFVSTHYLYNGKIHSTYKIVKALKNKIQSIEKIISVPYPVGEAEIAGDLSWDEFLSSGNDKINYVQVPFKYPLYIMFSSGTTGAPKCMVHPTGGVLLQHLKELKLHCNIKQGDSLLYFTTCGWMMWNWQLSALALGATIVLYDGSPAFPEIVSLWKAADKMNITHLGTSGRYIETCMGIQPKIKYGEIGAFSSLQTVLYTGSPLSANGFKWIYNTIKKDVHLAGISGGTDIVSCFVLGNPNLPVYAGQIQCRGLGIDVIALDEKGNEIIDEPGELVCRKPIPSMPVNFLNDEDGTKYFNAYFNIYPGYWRHGDYVEFLENGGVIIYGRSDATLNPGGVRIGCSEIYSAIEHLKFIKSSVAAGWIPPLRSDEVIILFVVLPDGVELTEDYIKQMKKEIKEKKSPRHVPQHIFKISEVPVTRSGKATELTIKSILSGKTAANTNALANPASLKEFEEIRNRLVKMYEKTDA